MASPILNCSDSPCRCRASSPASSWETQAASSSWCQSRQQYFLAMFLIHLSPSMQEAVGAGNHKTVAMVEPQMPCRMLKAATTSQSRRPRLSVADAQLLLGGERTTEGTAAPIPKVIFPSALIFFSFQNPGNGMCTFHNSYGNKAHKCIFPCSYWEN
jgi:hypothetical protein